MSRNSNHSGARNKKLAEQIYREARSLIVFFARNDLIKQTSIERVSVNRDLSLATLYVRFLNNPNQMSYQTEALKKEEIDERITELNHHNGFFRSHLAKALSLFKVPQIRFIYDDSFEQKKQIDILFEKINHRCT